MRPGRLMFSSKGSMPTSSRIWLSQSTDMLCRLLQERALRPALPAPLPCGALFRPKQRATAVPQEPVSPPRRLGPPFLRPPAPLSSPLAANFAGYPNMLWCARAFSLAVVSTLKGNPLELRRQRRKVLIASPPPSPFSPAATGYPPSQPPAIFTAPAMAPTNPFQRPICAESATVRDNLAAPSACGQQIPLAPDERQVVVQVPDVVGHQLRQAQLASLAVDSTALKRLIGQPAERDRPESAVQVK